MKKAIKRLFRSNYLFTAGVIICLFWIFAAILAPVIAPYSPTKPAGKFSQPPSGAHLLGTGSKGNFCLFIKHSPFLSIVRSLQCPCHRVVSL